MLYQRDNNLFIVHHLYLVIHLRYRTVYKLNVGHWRLVTSTEAALENADITSGTLLIPRTQLSEELANSLFRTHAIKSESAVGDTVVFSQSDEGLCLTAELLCFGNSRFDQLVLDQ